MFVTVLALAVLVLFSSLTKTVRAQTDTVAATVTAVVYAVSVLDGGVAFSTVAQNSTQDTTTGGVNDSQTATNDSSVTAKLSIKAQDSTGGAGWTLGPTAASETYTMKFCVTTCDASPTWTSVGIHPSYATLAASVAASGTQDFDLQVGTPTTTAETTQQSITVTVLAEAP